MNSRRLLVALVMFLCAPGHFSVRASTSGMLGIYGIVEKVVFEPNEEAPERVQVWGAFAYVNGTGGKSLTISSAKAGYLYFRKPGPDEDAQVVLNEWADLKSVAGTKQAVGFGSWMYFGGFGGMKPDEGGIILERSSMTSRQADLRVRPATEKPAGPTMYQTDAGIIKLSETGSHAEIVKQLKAALR
jgi:hypothetical protein